VSPKQLAKRLEKWAKAGIDVRLVDLTVGALAVDKGESQARAPKREGRLARSVRVVAPSSTRAAKTGVIRATLAAGSRSRDRGRAVPYAAVHQRGGRTRPHEIKARRADYRGGRIATLGVLAFRAGGRTAFARTAKHPGAVFRARDYLRVNEPRAATAIAEGVARGFDQDVG
jgi:hypothetical protein